MMKKFATVVLAVALLYGYFYSRPLRMNAPWKLRLTLTNWRILFKLCEIGELVGLGPFYENIRALATPIMKSRITNSSDVNVTVHTFSSIRTVVYQPASAKEGDPLRPAIIFFHGGGWVLGAPEMHQIFFMELIRQLDTVVVAVDYRKAPKHIFPSAYEDCYRVLHDFAAVARKFGVDQNRIAVSGDSAGGNLAAAVVGNLGNSKTKVSQLILIYPVLQGLDFQLPSYIENAKEEMLSRTLMARFWQLYILGSDTLPYTEHMLANNHSSISVRRNARKFIWNFLPGNPHPSWKEEKGDPEITHALMSATMDPLASPILLSDDALKKLPPVYIISCEFDALRDEALAFVGRLKSLDHRVVHRNYEAYHGLMSLFDFGIPEAALLVNDLVDYLRFTL